MLTCGNKSTGMRTMVVTPTTATTRQTMMTKYGYARANFGINNLPQGRARRSQCVSAEYSSRCKIHVGFVEKAEEPEVSRGHLRNAILAVNHQVHRGHEKDGQYDGHSQAADHRTSQRGVLFAARLHAECHGQQSQQGGEGSHQDGAQADFASFHHRLS